ncbi:hypothetical protein ETQ85_01190 [Zoogloea oleivorans]|uniref:Uncharacterized protein n=1 Tax=Zoogloea oleivorans TaxID=1552750 RepID=A0A6C2D7G9_9RHOO|nr:hypothetical protein [Zoogloea oleivorans]TYC62197.1 hypothetical protein ETQ85_01190 [Zoogloea oleivorans]
MDAELRLLFKDVLDSSLDIQDKKILMNELRKSAPPDENRWNFRIVVWTLAIVAISIPGYVLWTTSIGLGGSAGIPREIKIPEGLLSLGSTAIGALAAFLTSQRRKDEPLKNQE